MGYILRFFQNYQDFCSGIQLSAHTKFLVWCLSLLGETNFILAGFEWSKLSFVICGPN